MQNQEKDKPSKNLLVTGGSGFIGQYLIERLSREAGINIFATTRGKKPASNCLIHWIEVDLYKSGWTEKLPDVDFDQVIHLAQSHDYRRFPEGASNVTNLNVCATVELAQWAVRKQIKRFVFTSTGNVYGTSDRLLSESDLVTPDSFYGASKFCAEQLLKQFSDSMEILILRLFTVYGPGQTNAMIPGVIQRALAGTKITLADGIGVKFTPIYIEDCIEVLIKACSIQIDSPYEIFNIASDQIIDLKVVVEYLEKLMECEIPVELTEEHAKYLVGSVVRMSDKFGVAAIPFEEGLAKTYKSMIN